MRNSLFAMGAIALVALGAGVQEQRAARDNSFIAQNNYVTATKSVSIPTGGPRGGFVGRADVNCPAGWSMVGGGGQILGNDMVNFSLVGSYPLPHGYRASAQNKSLTDAMTINVYARCLKLTNIRLRKGEVVAERSLPAIDHSEIRDGEFVVR